MNKFTPGPWKVGNKFEVGKVSDADDQSFGMIDPLADVYGENKEADAKLISAAPDLLEALQGMLQVYGGVKWDTCSVEIELQEMAKSAIAKALA